MQNLTFKKQIIIGIVFVVLGFILGDITNIRFFKNIGHFIYGFLFFVNPVEPEKYKDYPNMKKWIRIIGGVIAFLSIITLFNK